MQITLEYMDPEHWPRPDGWTAVGRIGHQALAYDPERRPHLLTEVGPEPLDRDEVNRALVAAVDGAASKLWPAGWSHALPLAFKLNRRSVQRDRIERVGLHPKVLETLASASSNPDAGAFGALLSALALVADTHGEGLSVQGDIDAAQAAAGVAVSLLRGVRREKPFPRQVEGSD